MRRRLLGRLPLDRGIIRIAFQGVLPILQTSYRKDFTLDAETLGRQTDWLFGIGVDGVVLALVGEIVRQTDTERYELVRQVRGRGPVIASAAPRASPKRSFTRALPRSQARRCSPGTTRQGCAPPTGRF